MKIVFLSPLGELGGAERVLLSLLNALRTEPEMQLQLIVGSDGLLIEQARRLGIPVTVLPLPDRLNQLGDSALKGKGLYTRFRMISKGAIALPALLTYLHTLRQTIESMQPDVIHSNGIKTHVLTSLLGVIGTSNTAVPVIWHIHDFYGSRPVMARLLRWIGGRVAGAIAISQAVAQDIQSILPQVPIHLLYNTVDTTYFYPLLHRQQVDPVSPVKIGLVATFARWKGQDRFLEAAALVLKNYPIATFYIVGGAIYQTQGSQFSEQELRDRAEALQIADRVQFLGFQSNIVTVYRSLDIVVHASIQPEPFGLTIAEAMACGKPVIVSQAGGATELFTHGYDGLGVPPDDPVALADAIQFLVAHPQERCRLGTNARKTVIERFGSDRLKQDLLRIFYNLRAQNPPSPAT